MSDVLSYSKSGWLGGAAPSCDNRGVIFLYDAEWTSRWGRGQQKGEGCGWGGGWWEARTWHCEISWYTTKSGGGNVIGLYQQGVNILAQGGFAVAKQQEQRNQSHFCCSKEEKKSRRRRMGWALVVSCLLPSAMLPDPLQPLSLTGHTRPGWIARRVKTLRLWRWVRTASGHKDSCPDKVGPSGRHIQQRPHHPQNKSEQQTFARRSALNHSF